jgi:hypothetical protein
MVGDCYIGPRDSHNDSWKTTHTDARVCRSPHAYDPKKLMGGTRVPAARGELAWKAVHVCEVQSSRRDVLSRCWSIGRAVRKPSLGTFFFSFPYSNLDINCKCELIFHFNFNAQSKSSMNANSIFYVFIYLLFSLSKCF